MSLANQFIDFLSSLKSRVKDRNAEQSKSTLPPVFVERTPAIKRSDTPLGRTAPKIEKGLVKVDELPRISSQEVSKAYATENALDKGNLQDYINSYTSRFNVPVPTLSDTIVRVAKETGESPETLFRFARAESNFNPQAVNRITRAQGLFQILPSTWKDIGERLGGFKKGLTDPMNPEHNTRAAALYLQDIKRQLAPIKPDLTPGDLYLGHFSGAGRARQVLRALESGRGDLPASKLYLPREIKANKNIFYKEGNKMRTIREVYDLIVSKANSPEERLAARQQRQNANRRG